MFNAEKNHYRIKNKIITFDKKRIIMKADSQILDSYFGLLNNLHPSLKLKLIEKLSKSINKDIASKKDRMEKSFGSFQDSRDAEEIISEIRDSRTFNRKIEPF